MRVETILRRLVGGRCDHVHAVRLTAVLAVAAAVAVVGRLSICAVGRGLRSRARPKHGIKRVDRLLSNSHLANERGAFYAALGASLLAKAERPIVLVDWTQLTGPNYALVAAIPLRGRAVPIYMEAHPQKRSGTPKVEAAFLRNLQQCLPRGTRPIIVGDAGFRRPFFEVIAELDWDFVGRLRGRRLLHGPRGPVSAKELIASATAQVRDLGEYAISPKSVDKQHGRHGRRWGHLFMARLVSVHRRGRRRKRTANWSSRGHIRPKRPKAIQGAREGWLLVTSLRTCSAADVVAIYRLRMGIEQTFRDIKNHRWGWHLHHIRGRSMQRLNTLLLLVALALAALAVIGMVAQAHDLHRSYQANTSRSSTISIFILAAMLLRSPHPPPKLRLVLPQRAWWSLRSP